MMGFGNCVRTSPPPRDAIHHNGANLTVTSSYNASLQFRFCFWPLFTDADGKTRASAWTQQFWSLTSCVCQIDSCIVVRLTSTMWSLTGFSLEWKVKKARNQQLYSSLRPETAWLVGACKQKLGRSSHFLTTFQNNFQWSLDDSNLGLYLLHCLKKNNHHIIW